jgi:hypothetical protein
VVRMIGLAKAVLLKQCASITYGKCGVYCMLAGNTETARIT